MNEVKNAVLSRMNDLAETRHSFMIRRAALDCGVKQLKTQEAHEVVNVFLKQNPEYKEYLLAENGENPSFFSRGFVSDNESLPYECMEILGI